MSFAGQLEHESIAANILSEADIISSVTTLRRVCESCVGPRGRCHFIHNDVGGYVVTTSAVERLFSASQVSCPALRLLISAFQHHSSMHVDGATVTATLSLLMTEHALRMSVQHKQSLVVDLFDVVMDAATFYLTSDQCPVKRSLQLDNLTDLLQLLRGVLCTKPVCGMSQADVEHVACCVLKIALSQLSHNDDDSFSTIIVLGHAVRESYVQTGTVVEASHLPAYHSTTNPPRSSTTSTLSVARTTTSLLTGRRQPAADTASDDSITVVMFSASLAGSWDEDNLIADSVELDSDVDVDKFVVDHLLATAQTVVDCRADVLACQKVVHPRVKRFLRGHGVMMVDRLGRAVARRLAWQTGAQLIAAPFARVCSDQLGHLSRVSHEIISNKSYVCLEGGLRPVHTLVLCAVTEEAGAELKQASHAAYRVLLRAMLEQVVLVGAGAWQKHLADYVTDLGKRRAAELSEQFGCSRSDVMNITDCVAQSLRRVSRLIRPPSQQQQQQQPEVTSSEQPEVLDLLSSCVGGLKTAVLMTQSLLKLQFYSATT